VDSQTQKKQIRLSGQPHLRTAGESSARVRESLPPACVGMFCAACIYVGGVGRYLKNLADVWKSQPSLNDFDAGAHMRAKISELSPVTGLPAQICCSRPELPRPTEIYCCQLHFHPSGVCMGWDRAKCMYIPTQTLVRSILGGPTSMGFAHRSGELSHNGILLSKFLTRTPRDPSAPD
jgi:hypothetical protein